MWDCKAAFLTGAVKSGKVRILWKGGILRAYNETGKTIEINSQQPTRKRGRILARAWVAVTDNGEVEISERCFTCGGWWRLAMIDADKLWGE